MQKAQADIQKAAAVNGHGEDTNVDGGVGRIVIHEDGTVRIPADDNASTRGMLSPSSPNGPSAADGNDGPIPIPTIRVSTESDRATREETLITHSSDNGESQENGTQEIQGLEKPVQAAASEEKDSSDPSPSPNQEPFSFSNKRLCERWLDNLFMVLYEVGNCFHKLWGYPPDLYFRTFGSGPSSAQRLLISKPNMWHTVKLGSNGRYLGTWGCAYITEKRLRKLISVVWIHPATQLNRG